MPDAPALDIVVLAGGISHERDVSLRSGRRVADGLTAAGHRVTLREPDATLLAHLAEHRPDVVWPALHGASGEDGALRGLLDALALPYVGARSNASGLAWNKPVAKTVVQAAGVATPDWITVTRDAFRELGASSVLDAVLHRLDTPVVVKPASGGSAQGVSLVDDRGALPRALVDAFTYSELAIIERRVVGTEVSVGIVDTGSGPTALPLVEIEPVSGDYSFEARYNAGETVFYAPARLDESLAATVSDAGLAAHAVLGLRHISRVDFIVDDAGTPWFLEANVLPGLTETSLLPQAIEAAGLRPGNVYADLARTAMADGTD